MSCYRVASSFYGKGTSTFTYNGDDSLGRRERRGLTTKVNVGLASGPSEFSGAYDDSGALAEQNYPGGIKAKYTHDLSGAETGLSYTQTVGGVESDLLGFSQQVDNDGRVRNAVGPDSEQVYTFDDRDRLSTVVDTAGNQCTTRIYGFSGDSNRTSLKTYLPGTAGVCQSTTGSTASSTFDAADRITGTGYTYDKLGRTLTVPATDTSNPAGGNLAAGYHVNDMVATLSQTVFENGANVVKGQDFTLDVAGRLSVTKNLTANMSLKESTNHYDGSDDSPVWTETKTRPDASTAWTTPTWSRYVSGLGGMAIIQGFDGKNTIQLANLHDDIIATADIVGTGISSYSEYTEYGLARDPANTPDRYGWLGTNQRDADTIGGLTLMGARLYNPTTGRFLTRDPVAGGNDNTYTYPADPINLQDIRGMATKWLKGYKDIKLSAKRTKKLIKALRRGGKTEKLTNTLAKFVPNARVLAYALKFGRIGAKALAAGLEAKLAIGRKGVVIRIGFRKFKGGGKGWIPPWPAYKIAPRYKSGGTRGWL